MKLDLEALDDIREILNIVQAIIGDGYGTLIYGDFKTSAGTDFKVIYEDAEMKVVLSES